MFRNEAESLCRFQARQTQRRDGRLQRRDGGAGNDTS
jgi:hypothetical protein